MDLLGQVKASAQVADFAKLALQAHHKDVEKAEEVSCYEYFQYIKIY